MGSSHRDMTISNDSMLQLIQLAGSTAKNKIKKKKKKTLIKKLSEWDSVRVTEAGVGLGGWSQSHLLLPCAHLIVACLSGAATGS